VKQNGYGGYVVAGEIDGNLLIFSVNEWGHDEWSYTYDLFDYMYATSLFVLGGNNHIILGTYHDSSTGNSNNVILMLIDAEHGGIDWYRTFGVTDSDYSKNIEQTSDGGYLIVSNPLLVKTDSDGNEEWSVNLYDDLHISPNSGLQNSDDEYIITGFDLVNNDIMLIKLASYAGPVWHVSTTGSDETGNGSEDSPFATIQTGINNAIDGDTVSAAAGTYVENINFNGKNIAVIGEDRNTTIIDGNQAGSVVTFNSGENYDALLSGFTLTNGNSYEGGGIHCYANPTITDVIITGNTSQNGGGIKIGSSTPTIYNVEISNNIATSSGGGIYSCCASANTPTVENITFYGNVADVNGGGIYNGDNGMIINNSIFWNNLPEAINPSPANGPFSVYFSNLPDSIQDNAWLSDGNIDANPLFCEPDNGDFSLAENSPCVGTGENGANMGAFGVGCGPIYFGNIVINEIMQNPSAVTDSDGEWFELYNNSEEPADISGWVIKDSSDDSLVIAENTPLINSYSYFVLGTNNDTTTNGGVFIDYVYDRENFNLGNADDEIIILAPYENEIDRLEYDGGTTFPDPNGKSMELIYYNLDNDDGSNWVESGNMLPSGDCGTPGEGNSTLQPSLMTNINADCQGGVNNGWMELGDIEINDTSECMLFVENAGYGELILSNIHIGEGQNDYPNTAFSVTVDSLVIPPEGSDTIVVYFYPEVAGYYSGSLSFETNGESNPTHNEAVHGTGLSPVREIFIETDFASDTIYYYDVPLGDSTYAEYAYITNLGLTTLEIDDIVATEPFHVFISDASLGLLEYLELPIFFIPASEGTYSGTVTIYSNDSDEEEVIINLYGETETLSINEILIPDKFTLHQNHPNPFNPVTTLRYDLPEDALVNITIYDMMGRQVKSLVNGSQTAGYRTIQWNATNDRNEPVSAGLYLYTIQAGDYTQTNKMVLLK